ncbi:hypothetical protein BDD12DRAFT_850205, partial [Trichophaea hybrida]
MTKKLFHQVHTYICMISPPCIFSVYSYPHNCSNYIHDPKAPSRFATANRAMSFVCIVLTCLAFTSSVSASMAKTVPVCPLPMGISLPSLSPPLGHSILSLIAGPYLRCSSSSIVLPLLLTRR